VSTQSIPGWVACATANPLPSQSRTLALSVAAAIRTERPDLATIGRRLAGPTIAKGAIKRAWRPTANARVEVAEAMAGTIARLVRKRKERLIASFDWAEVRSFHTPAAAAGIGGRAVPLMWASYPRWELRRSQNSPEEGLLRRRSLIPESVPVVILADRGFGRAEWAAVCQELGFRYMVRIKPAVTVAGAISRGAGPLPGPQGHRAHTAPGALPQGRAGDSPHRHPLAAGAAEAAGRAVIPEDRPGGPRRGAVPAVRPADERRGAVPRLRGPARRPGPAGHAAPGGGTIRPLPAGGGAGVPAAGGVGAEGESWATTRRPGAPTGVRASAAP
jgi:hypothetical protein